MNRGSGQCFELSIPVRGLLAAVVAMALAVPVVAQFGRSRSTVFENARLIMPDGSIIEDGVIVVQGGKIARIGTSSELVAPERARRVDLAGATVTPGFIDVSALAGNTASGGGDASMLAVDGFDHYASRPMSAALQQGVTTGFVSPRGGAGINGVGAVMSLAPRGEGSWGEAVDSEAALCINLGSADQPIRRLQTVDAIRKAFKAAQTYRESFDTYSDDLEEYEKKLAERADAQPTDEAEEAEQEDDEDGDEDQPQVQGRRRRPPGGRGRPPTSPADENKDESKSDDELKKPTEPKKNAANEMLLKALDHELPVRIAANSSADILNAIAITQEFGLKLVIEGGAEAHLVSSQLAKAEAVVILEYSAAAVPGRSAHSRPLNDVTRGLEDAGVTWLLGSARQGGDASRFLLFQAQAAVQGLDVDPIDLITARAAEALGLEDVGSLAQGSRADLVVWTHDPRDPAARCRAVYIGGTLARDFDAGGEG